MRFSVHPSKGTLYVRATNRRGGKAHALNLGPLAELPAEIEALQELLQRYQPGPADAPAPGAVDSSVAPICDGQDGAEARAAS